MKVTTPHMGTIDMLLEDLFARTGVDYFPAPPTTRRTVELGARYAPEAACLPLKVTLGNLMEGLEAGADATLMLGGVGPCRFGYYADLQRRVLQRLGYEFEPVILEPPAYGWISFLRTLRKLAPGCGWRAMLEAYRTTYRKALAIDRLEAAVLRVRCREAEHRATDRARLRGLELLRAAVTPAEIDAAEAEAVALVEAVPVREDADVLRVSLLGEFYMVLEPFANLELERFLGSRDVLVERGTCLTDWIGPGKKKHLDGRTPEEIAAAAAPYLEHTVGGEGRVTIGRTVLAKRDGFDGIVQVMPFTCMPDTIAKSILPNVSAREDIPVLTLVIDEQSGEAGVHTRLEAFVDLLRSRRARAAAGVGRGSDEAVLEPPTAHGRRAAGAAR
ncbi:MAG: CoA protein activase [Coriobacteriia bacterium]|nr:CoA protein activase [Coriobacteriia bacterium]